MEVKIAVLLTCHNRVLKTMDCLKKLFAAELPLNWKLQVFLVDDGSTDETNLEVTTNFPMIKVIMGNGNLFWNGGMRLAWVTASESYDFDFYLWLNDDTIIDQSALVELSRCYEEGKDISGNEVIITAACRSEIDSNEFSYGGRNDSGAVVPDGTLQQCTYINGNLVLIPRAIYKKIGQLSERFTHAIGDFDYGLRAQKNGFACYTTRNFIATCAPNTGTPKWCNPYVPLRERLQVFRSPRGLNISEYLIYQRTHFGYKGATVAYVKSYARVLFPAIYNRFKK